MATTTEAALEFLPRAKTVVTGYPVRGAFSETSRTEARAALGLKDTDTVILVAGASQGAGAINRAIFAGLRMLIEHNTVFHITGTGGIAEASALQDGLGDDAARYHPSAFRDDLPTLMLAADLAVMRAGASVLGELPAASLPSVLVPGTFAGGHQRDNAGWLAAAGAADILEESRIDELATQVLALVTDRPKLTTMRAAAARCARPEAAASIANLILEVAKR
jgi:UDP-N-acetylglucosamine--N-acetylmuramyl-(pentapeptide) pyrophosphoryl-undecaprenol N-acetylglucosamine transferase